MADWMELGATVLGGLLGYKAGGDKTQTSTQTRDPWAPAQPYLLDNLKTNADLQKYYQQNPFNAQQKTSYNNLFGDLDNFRNNTAPGLMDFANNAMTGSYQRPQQSQPGMVGYSQRPQQGQQQQQQQPPPQQQPSFGSDIGNMMGLGQWQQGLATGYPQARQLSLGDEDRFSSSPQPQQPRQQEQGGLSPADFKSMIYEGGANDQEAVRRGLQYSRQQNMSPQEAVDFFNNSLDKNFTVDNYRTASGNQALPGAGASGPFSVNRGTSYGAVDFEAMNPFSAQNKPTPPATTAPPATTTPPPGVLLNGGLLSNDRINGGNGNGGNVGAGNSGDGSFSGFGGLSDAVGGGFGFGSDNTYGIGSEFNGDKALSGVKAGASFGPAGMALGGLFGGLFGGYKSQAEIDAEVADMDQRLSAQDSRRHGGGSGFGNGSGYNSGFGGDSSHGTQGY